jgi:hypothetical protein
MADDSKLPNIGGNGFVWILLAVAGTYFATHPLPLSGSRPAGTDRSLIERVGEQHVVPACGRIPSPPWLIK